MHDNTNHLEMPLTCCFLLDMCRSINQYIGLKFRFPCLPTIPHSDLYQVIQTWHIDNNNPDRATSFAYNGADPQSTLFHLLLSKYHSGSVIIIWFSQSRLTEFLLQNNLHQRNFTIMYWISYNVLFFVVVIEPPNCWSRKWVCIIWIGIFSYSWYTFVFCFP